MTGRDCSIAIAALVIAGGGWLVYVLLTQGAR